MPRKLDRIVFLSVCSFLVDIFRSCRTGAWSGFFLLSFSSHVLSSSLLGSVPNRRSVVAMIDRIDPAHRFFARLFFDYVRDQAGRARDHEDAVERRRIHSQIGKNCADRAVYIDRQALSWRRRTIFRRRARLSCARHPRQLRSPARTAVRCADPWCENDGRTRPCARPDSLISASVRVAASSIEMDSFVARSAIFFSCRAQSSIAPP